MVGQILAADCSLATLDLTFWLIEIEERETYYRAMSVCVCICVVVSISFIFEDTAAAAKSRQSCLTLCDTRDGSPPGSPVPGILQARTLEWVAISFSNARKWKVEVKSLSRVRPLANPWTAAHQSPPSMGFSSGVPLPLIGWNYKGSSEKYIHGLLILIFIHPKVLICQLLKVIIYMFSVYHLIPRIVLFQKLLVFSLLIS